MTMIVAWRDPFSMASDDLETGDRWGATKSSGPKIKPIPDTRLACGISGLGSALDGVIAQIQSLLPVARNWHVLEMKTRQLINAINAPLPDKHKGVTVVVAGTLDGTRDLFAWGTEMAIVVGPNESLLGQPHAFGGSGGLNADIARRIATQYWPDLTGEALLRTIAKIGTDTDPHSGRPIYRIDLGQTTLKSEVWIP